MLIGFSALSSFCFSVQIVCPSNNHNIVGRLNGRRLHKRPMTSWTHLFKCLKVHLELGGFINNFEYINFSFHIFKVLDSTCSHVHPAFTKFTFKAPAVSIWRSLYIGDGNMYLGLLEIADRF